MEFEFWWLLALPLCFALGWLASRLERRERGHRADALPDAYFRGLNFLLNEQPDKAIDAFIDVVRIEPETLELHFALGNLFRRRGETDRAIRVHQNLVDRALIDPLQRENALFELGQDYLRAGLLDRAEEAFNRLSQSSHAAQALRHRLEMAQMVRDWPLAITLARQLQDQGEDRHTLDREMAHFRCEIALQALAEQGPDHLERAQDSVAMALARSPTHPRARIMAGEIALALGQPQVALTHWRGLRGERPQYLALIAASWLEAHAALGRLREGVDELGAVQESHPSTDLLLALARSRVQTEGVARAIAWLEAELERQPSLLGLQTLTDLRLEAAPPTARAELELTRRLIAPQASRLSRYACQRCGFKARQYHWQCPGCAGWDSYPPRRTEELER